jgi:hypothetical protein
VTHVETNPFCCSRRVPMDIEGGYLILRSLRLWIATGCCNFGTTRPLHPKGPSGKLPDGLVGAGHWRSTLGEDRS